MLYDGAYKDCGAYSWAETKAATRVTGMGIRHVYMQACVYDRMANLSPKKHKATSKRSDSFGFRCLVRVFLCSGSGGCCAMFSRLNVSLYALKKKCSKTPACTLRHQPYTFPLPSSLLLSANVHKSSTYTHTRARARHTTQPACLPPPPPSPPPRSRLSPSQKE